MVDQDLHRSVFLDSFKDPFLPAFCGSWRRTQDQIGHSYQTKPFNEAVSLTGM